MEVAALWFEDWMWSWIIVRARPMSVGRCASNGKRFFKAVVARLGSAVCAAALRTERALV